MFLKSPDLVWRYIPLYRYDNTHISSAKKIKVSLTHCFVCRKDRLLFMEYHFVGSGVKFLV